MTDSEERTPAELMDQLEHELRRAVARDASLTPQADLVATLRETAMRHRERLARNERQQAALLELTQLSSLAAGDVTTTARQATELVTEAMDVARVGVWLLEDGGKLLRCIDLFEREEHRHDTPGDLHAETYPRYFEALEAGRSIDADDARNDPRTSEFRTAYLEPCGIQSMLDAAIRVAGRVVGIVCHEHVGAWRHWRDDEIAFAGAVADQMALAMMNAERRRTEGDLVASERRLEETNQMLQLVLDTIPVRVFWKDSESRYLGCNRNFARDSGHESPEEMIGLDDDDMSWADRAELYRADDRAVMESGRAKLDYEESVTSPDGHTILVRSSKYPLHDLEGRVIGMLGTFEDITEAKRIDARLRASEERYRELVETSHDLIWSVDTSGCWRFVNAKAAQNIYGYEPHEMLGRSFTEFTHPDHLERDLAAFEEIKAGNPHFRHETVHLRKDGEPVHMSFTAIARHDADGEVQGTVGTATDVSARKEAEAELARYRDGLEELVRERTRALEKTEEKLGRSERLALLGQLTATVAHEIRNPLGTVRTSLYSIADALDRDQPERIDRALKLAGRSIMRCDTIIEELLHYSRRRPISACLTPVDGWLAQLLEEQEPQEGVQCRFQPRAATVVPLDREMLRRAVVNILQNAYQAIQDSPSGERRVDVDTELVGGRVEIRIRDTGPGMTQDVVERIFEPLYSTKSYGIGLGVPLVRDIMQAHGGDVDYETEPRRGTTVTLWLPLPPVPEDGDPS